MSRVKQGEASKEKHPEEKVSLVILIALAGLIAPAYFFYKEFNNLPSGGPTDWAAFGSFYSGIATPVIAFCSALIFFRSIVVQRREFEETRKEMREATDLQLSAEHNRVNINKQQQLERVIPLAREKQLASYKEIESFPDKYRDSIGAYDLTGFSTPTKELRRILEHYSGTRNELKALSSNYFDEGVHVIKMINQYLNHDGDIYFHLNVIKSLESEYGSLREFIYNFKLQGENFFLNYDDILHKLITRRDEVMVDY